MSAPRALIIDDEPDICALLSLSLSKMGIESSVCQTFSSALQALQSEPYDLCLTDLRLPDGSGLDLVKAAQQKLIPIAVITAHGNIEAAIDAMKAGAFDFISKPIELNHLRSMIEAALSGHDSKEVTNRSITLIGSSPCIKNLTDQVQRVAHSQAPIYISGPSGSGKERVARLIHAYSPRSCGPFIPVNCGAIPQSLMESEFFGHMKGSFTGANANKKGLFQSAENGTLFLDEVADLPLDMQVKLLRAIQERSIRPIGSAHEISVNIRILCATHQDLNQCVAEGRFREDLFYRLNVIELKVPSLSEHIDDVADLSAHILQRMAHSDMPYEQFKLSPQALDALKAYPFPGNVRELENILERACTLCRSQLIGVEDLQLPKQHTENQGYEAPLDDYLQQVEKEAIVLALTECDGNVTRAAEHLGISFRSLRYRLEKLGIKH